MANSPYTRTVIPKQPHPKKEGTREILEEQLNKRRIPTRDARFPPAHDKRHPDPERK